MTRNEALFKYLLRLGDTALVLGHRVSEWCGHAPILEEDIALANTALDLIGQTRLWLGLAVKVEGKGRSADDLAYLRDAHEFRNALLVECPNGDFGKTMMRQFLHDAHASVLLARLQASTDSRIADIAGKIVKEVAYHLERSRGTVIGLGDGTEESRAQMQYALDDLWPYTGELFHGDAVEDMLDKTGIAPRPDRLRCDWLTLVKTVLAEATLCLPESSFAHRGGRSGHHTEHLGHMLATMQFLQRAYPGAIW